MATYNGNDVYLDLDGTQVDSYFVNVSLEPAIETVDITAGSGATHRQRAEGLKDSGGSMQIAYDVTAIATLLPLIEVGTHTLTYGPEGNGNGKPKHVQSIIITGAPHTVAVSKDMVVFDVSFEAAAAPTTDMFNGGVWA
ncbi:MAG: hypothetical protein LC121_13460 [Anaerolineae bacterium]|nr:hypothetical protein [Anaerolineae bacterium]